MAKGGSSMGGIGGSGIFGMFGTVVQSKSTDTSLYCTLAKTINMIFMIGILLFFIYFAWTYIRGTFGKKVGGYLIRKSRKSRNVGK